MTKTVQLPDSLIPLYESLDPVVQEAVIRDYRSRKKSYEFGIWSALIGWQYLYLGRVGMQFAFWFTCGGLWVWYVIDIFRLNNMVERFNEDLAKGLIVQYKALNQK